MYRDDASLVLIAPRRVGCERTRRARVEIPVGPRVRKHLREARRIAQPEVESLARDRVQRLRGIADDREALTRVTLRPPQPELVRLAAADRQDASQPEAEGLLQFCEECLVGRIEQPPGLLGMARPHEPAAAVADGQHRDGSFRGESLVGHVVVEALRHQRRGDRDLPVLPVLGADARLLPHQRASPVGSDDEPRIQLPLRPAGLDSQRTPVALDRARRHARRCERLDRGAVAQALLQGRADHAVRDDAAERLQALRGGVDACRAESPLVAHVDAADRCRLALHVPPHVEAPEDANAAVRERGGALVEAGMITLPRRGCLDDHDAQAQRRECQGERGAHQPSARDGNVVVGLCRGHAHRAMLSPPSTARSGQVSEADRR